MLKVKDMATGEMQALLLRVGFRPLPQKILEVEILANGRAVIL